MRGTIGNPTGTAQGGNMASKATTDRRAAMRAAKTAAAARRMRIARARRAGKQGWSRDSQEAIDRALGFLARGATPAEQAAAREALARLPGDRQGRLL